jgi:PAS domain-containing protein
MAQSFSSFLKHLANYVTLHREDMLGHLLRMAAIEAHDKDIPPPDWRVVGIWDWDAVNDLNHLDEDCATLFGVDPLEARKGMPNNLIIKSIHPDDAGKVTDDILRALHNGGPYECQYRVIAHGKTRHVRAKGVCTLDKSGRPERFPGVILELPESTQLH